MRPPRPSAPGPLGAQARRAVNDAAALVIVVVALAFLTRATLDIPAGTSARVEATAHTAIPVGPIWYVPIDVHVGIQSPVHAEGIRLRLPYGTRWHSLPEGCSAATSTVTRWDRDLWCAWPRDRDRAWDFTALVAVPAFVAGRDELIEADLEVVGPDQVVAPDQVVVWRP